MLTLPIQALTMHDPATDAAKKQGRCPGGIGTRGSGAKLNPVQGVFVVEKDHHGRLRAKFVPVTTGITGATDIEVLSGLSHGQEVVSGPYKTLRDLKGGALLKRDTAKTVYCLRAASRAVRLAAEASSAPRTAYGPLRIRPGIRIQTVG